MNGERPRGLDLFCGAGGASFGYHKCGFQMVGVDNEPMPRYPYEFIQWDALDTLKRLVSGYQAGGYRLGDFDFIHASPPCQRYSVASLCRPGLQQKYPDLIEPVRFLLRRTGLPYVIENVPGAPLVNPVTLCGSQFGMSVDWEGHGNFYLRRHREFESGHFTIADAGPHDHTGLSITVAGHNPSRNRPHLRGPGYQDAARRLMGINWMRREELNESVPPAYAFWVGLNIRDHLGLGARADVLAG